MEHSTVSVWQAEAAERAAEPPPAMLAQRLHVGQLPRETVFLVYLIRQDSLLLKWLRRYASAQSGLLHSMPGAAIGYCALNHICANPEVHHCHTAGKNSANRGKCKASGDAHSFLLSLAMPVHLEEGMDYAHRQIKKSKKQAAETKTAA